MSAWLHPASLHVQFMPNCCALYIYLHQSSKNVHMQTAKVESVQGRNPLRSTNFPVREVVAAKVKYLYIQFFLMPVDFTYQENVLHLMGIRDQFTAKEKAMVSRSQVC